MPPPLEDVEIALERVEARHDGGLALTDLASVLRVARPLFGEPLHCFRRWSRQGHDLGPQAAGETECAELGARALLDPPPLGPSPIESFFELSVPLGMTHSCYDPVGADASACGACDSCILRRRGFAEAGVPDPTRYAGAVR